MTMKTTRAVAVLGLGAVWAGNPAAVSADYACTQDTEGYCEYYEGYGWEWCVCDHECQWEPGCC